MQTKETIQSAESLNKLLTAQKGSVTVSVKIGDFYKDVSINAVLGEVTQLSKAQAERLANIEAILNKLAPSELRTALMAEVAGVELDCQLNIQNCNRAKSDASRGVRYAR